MTTRSWILLAGLGSLALLAAAFLFQALGWAPCQMCLWQRWPHAAAIAIGAAGLALPSSLLAGLGALSAAVASGLGVYHSGVERDWWAGPASCSAASEDLSTLSGASLLPGAADAPGIVLCDAFTPFLFGLSMANWNALASAALVALWLCAAFAPRRA